ncbi:serine-rich adhesin for platelets-like [Littorina saxatilis]|uniref:serine-rich adhesin for platelets-like n=1 Tax=Littorina saxatilis TaxID=31220 RepID=UPI0038B6A721
MAKQEDTIRQLRTEFENQWSDLFPSSPTPPIRALSSLRFHGDDEGNTHGGVPFDEWMSSGAIEQLGNSLRVTEEKISQLTDQLSRKTCLRDFLLRLLECLGDSGEGRGSRPLPVNNLPTSQAVLDPTCVKTLSQQGSTNGGSTLFANEERQGSSCKRSESKPLVPRRNFSISSEKGSETRKQTTVLPRGRPSLTEGFDSGVTSKSVQGKCTLTATTASLSCHGQQSTASGTAGTDDTLHQNGSATQCVVATQEKQHSGKQTCDGAVTRIDSSSRPKAALRDNTPHNHNGSEKQSDGTLYENCQGRKWRQCSSNHGSVGTIDYSTRNQVGGETTREDHNNAVGLPIAQQGPSTAHSAKSSQGATVISVNGTQSQPTSHLFGSSANATGEHWAQTSEGSAQTDISFGVREQWVVSSTDEDRNSPSSTMFWNKKKSSGKRTQEEVRERDNSGVLGRYSDTPDLPAPPPLSATPFRSSIERLSSNSPRNVQYLKLTDGFNIAFGTGETPPPLPQKQNKPRPQQQPPKNETAVEEYYETYDNNTAKRAAQKSGGAPPFVSAGSAKVSDDDKPEQVSHGSEAGRYENVSHNSGSASGIRNPVSNVTPSVSPSGTPLTPSAPPMSEEDGGHVSVSRSSSDGNSHAGSVRAAPLEASNSLKSSPKPQPHPRRKQLPPLPAKQKPSSVFYVENTTTSVSPATGGGVVVVQAAARERKRDDVDAEGRTWGRRGDGDDHHTKWEQDRREGSSSVDTEISSPQSVESGRVSSIRTGALPHAGHTRPQGDTRAERVQSNEPSLNTNSPTRVDQFVVSTSVKTRDDQEPNKAATVLQSVVEVDESTTGSTAERSSRAFPTQHTTLSARSAREEDQNEKPELAVAAGRQNIQSRTRQDRTETEGLSYHGTDPSSANDRGGRDLCGTNVIGGGEINQYSGSAASGAGSSGTTASGANASATDHDSDSANSADMLRFHRRTLSSGSAKRDAVEQSAVYRKTEDTRATPKPAFRHSAELPPGTMQPIHEDRLKGDGRGEVEATPPPTPQPDYDDHHELSSTDTGEEAHTHPKYQETDLDSDTTVSFAMLRTKNSPPAPPPKPQKKPKVNVYENWTINRAITQDFDLYEEDDSDDTSPACTLERGSTKGSKDSGLCLDVQGNHSVVADLAGDAAAAAVIAVGKGFGERVKDAARISSIEELNRMHDEEDYANVSHHHRQNCEDSPDQEDNVCE